jgi:small subunit ribosomal protein S18
MEPEKKTKKGTQIEFIDYKDVARVRAHLNPHARMMGRSRTGLSAREQRGLSQAVKRARFMALVPYIAH